MTNGQLRTYLQSRSKLVNGCIVWQLKPSSRGYGKAKIEGKTIAVHRLAYEEYKYEKIPEDLTIDHLCFNRMRNNPGHLEVVTIEENQRRWYEKFKKDNPNFPCGHPRFDDSVIEYKAGKNKSGSVKKQRRCQVCWKKYQKEYHRNYSAKTKQTLDNM